MSVLRASPVRLPGLLADQLEPTMARALWVMGEELGEGDLPGRAARALGECGDVFHENLVCCVILRSEVRDGRVGATVRERHVDGAAKYALSTATQPRQRRGSRSAGGTRRDSP